MIFVADTNANSLLDYRFMPHRSAGNGTMGIGDTKDGSQGDDLRMPVQIPSEVLTSLRHAGEEFVAAAGGAGGLGNAALANRTRREPGFALLGEPGEERVPHRSAGTGTLGLGDTKDGSHGADLRLPVPIGTVVCTARGAEVQPNRHAEDLSHLRHAGDEFLAAAGGAGGLGNAALAYRTRRAPGFALLGEPGEERDVILELKWATNSSRPRAARAAWATLRSRTAHAARPVLRCWANRARNAM